MHKNFILSAALLAALSVGLGAFGAHGLKQILPADILQTFETAVRYQMYHAFALLIVGILYQHFPGKLLLWSGWLFIAGILLFSGSLYLLCFVKYQNMLNLLWFGAITPLGGLCFIAGWVLIASAVIKQKAI